MVGWSGHAGPNPMQRADCWSCGQAGVGGGVCGNCGATSQDPYVLVFDVGQGNCNAIVGASGKVVAYYDFGYATDGGKFPTPPTKPCFCDEPMIVLSHWDKDHINMSKHVTECYTAQWLVPEQGHSDFATKLQDRIKEAGGRLHTVPFNAAVRHQVFPWGYVERCSGAANDPNGSGLAAFVCVRSSPRHPAPPAGVAAVPGLTASGASPVLVRARAAYNATFGAVPGMHPTAVRRLARSLAAVLAASQTMAGRQPHMPVGECVTAAVAAAVRVVVDGDNAVNTAAALNLAGVLGTLRGHNAGWAATVVDELAAAAVAAHPKRTYSTRVQAAAANLTHDGSIKPAAWTWLGVLASRLPAPAPPALNAGHAPHAGDERFILLNGDAEYQYVPSMQVPKRPSVVGMTAMHHGAIYECTTFLQGPSIPFAPGSRAAQSVLRFRDDRANAAGGLNDSVVSVVTEAGLALQRRTNWHRRRNLRVVVSRVARAAAAAIYSLHYANPGEVAASPGKFAAVAAAAAVAALRHRDAGIVGLAAMLATTNRGVANGTGTSPLETVVTVAAKAITARRGGPPGLTVEQLTDISAGALDGDLIPLVVLMANAAVTNGNQACTPDNAGQEAASALGELWGSYKHGSGLSAKAAKNLKKRIELDNGDENVINDLATAAVAAIQASAAGSDRHRMATSTNAAGNSVGVAVAQLPALAGQVRTTVQRSYWAAPMLAIDLAALDAARWAAERIIAYEVGTTAEAVRTVIDSAHDARLRRHAYRAFGTKHQRNNGRGGHIAYSYGVEANAPHAHGYASQTVSAGYCGHAHPLAVFKYEARGWVRRFNASSRSRHRGVQGDPDKTHPFGHMRLGWNSVDDTVANGGPAQFRCTKCGKSYQLQG